VTINEDLAYERFLAREGRGDTQVDNFKRRVRYNFPILEKVVIDATREGKVVEIDNNGTKDQLKQTVHDIVPLLEWKHSKVEKPAADPAQKANEGGIDFTSDRALSVQNNGQGIQFHIDPAQLKELESAPGFVPVIISIKPMTNIRIFLGLNTA
jgi:hypothetical protein